MNRKIDFRGDIEGLRGIAVIAVVAFHSGIKGLSGGFTGVDIFFVLSGYLISGMLVNEIARKSRLNVLEFYARRVRRLLPASAAVIVLTLALGAIVLAPGELAFTGRAARAAAVYASNLFFAFNATGYFSPNVKSNPMLHMWSLAVEEQFYMVWPFLIMFGWRFSRSGKPSLLFVLTGVTLLSMAWCIWSTGNAPVFAFYSLPARAWEFGAGGLFAFIPGGVVRVRKEFWTFAGWLGLLMIVASAHLISSRDAFPGWIALVPVLGTCIVLLAGSEQPHRGASSLLEAGALQFVGRLSYSWYLLHWPFLVFVAALFPGVSIRGRVASAVGALGLAIVLHYCVENPVRFRASLVARPALSLISGAVLMCVLVLTAILTIRLAARLAETPRMIAIGAAADDVANMSRSKCVSQGESSAVQTCVFGNTSSTTTLALFGDSHAIQWFDALHSIVLTRGWKLVTYLKSGCPATDVTPPASSTKFAADCAAWRRDSAAALRALDPSLVVLGNSSTYLATDESPGLPISEWRDGTRRTLRTFASARIPVMSIRDTPRPGFDVPSCLARAFRLRLLGLSCNIGQEAAVNVPMFEAEKSAAAGLPGIYFADFTGSFCEKGTCPPSRNGVIVYRDDNHMAGSFAATLAIPVQSELLQVLALPGSGLHP